MLKLSSPWQHCSDSDHTTRPLLLVTASVDKISTKKRLRVDVDLELAGSVTWVGRSSMEIRMEVIQPVRGAFQAILCLFMKFSSRQEMNLMK